MMSFARPVSFSHFETMSSVRSPPSSPSRSSPSTSSSNQLQPFFIMDWLEDLVQDQDVDRIAQMLRTPNKEPHDWSPPGTPKSSNCRSKKKLNTSASAPTIMQPTLLFTEPKDHSSHPLQKSKKKSQSSIYERSLALGNGWNAKGLKKAQQGLWEDALACWDHALEIRLPLLGKQHLEVANTYNNRGIALGKLGNYPQALEALEEALVIRIPLLGDSHSQVISTLHNIANVHQQAGYLQQALLVFTRAKDLGRNPTQVARICLAMGHVYYQAEQWVDARDAYHDAYRLLSLQGELCDKQELLDLQRDIQELDRRVG